MSDTVTLTAYADQVRELIHHDRDDEAIAICKHILKHYPKYIDAYRQMGEAYLEKNDTESAKDLFRRVLSADPENIVAYVGLAAIFEQQHLINEAIWHIERAYELAPGNYELQKELLRLYNESDVKSHSRLKLTTGALGRVYAQEGLFNHAIQEFRAIIATLPARWDIRVALAETLWRNGRMSEAAQVAQSVLEQLPYCLKANLIIGAAWKEAGLMESDTYLQRAQSLDPMNLVASRLLGARSPLPVEPATVERYIEGVPPPLETPTAEEIANFEKAIAEPEPSTEITFTATPFSTEEPSDTLAQPLTTTPDWEATSEVSPTALPDWLQAPSPGTTEESRASVSTEETPSWLSESQESSAIVQAPEASQELSSWVSQQATVESAEEAVPDWLAQPSAELPAQPQIPLGENLPAWLKDQQAQATPSRPRFPSFEEPAQEPQAATEPPVAQNLPDWLSADAESTPAPSASITEPSTPVADATLPDWLGTLREPSPSAEEPAVSITSAEVSAEQPPAEALPSWLSTPTLPSTEQPSTNESLRESVIETEEAKPQAVETEPAADQVPQWLAQLQAQTDAAAQAAAMQEENVTAEEALRMDVPVVPSEPPASVTPKRKRQPKGYNRLVQARMWRDANMLKDALVEYDYLVQHAPRLVNDVIDDLELLIQRINIPLEAHRILGDAYTRVDRLAEALAQYNFVLEHSQNK